MTTTDLTTYGPQTDAPHDALAEQALIGALLVNAEAREGLPWLRAEHFYLHHHRYIFEAVLAVGAAGLTVDVVTLADELARAGRLGEIGGTAYLARCMGACANSYHALSYARVVEREWQRRELLAAATKLAESAYTGRHEPRAVLADIERALTGRGGATALSAADVAGEVWEVVAYPERQAARLVATGLRDWDAVLGGGLERGTLAVIMARPSMGKTALLVQIADYVSEQGGVVAVFSLEMTSRQFLLRMACRRARVSVLALKQGKANDDQRSRVLQEIAALSERRNLILDDTPQTTDTMRATCDHLARAGRLDLVMSDHLRLFADRGDNDNKRLGGISWAHKRMAKALDIPVLCAAQLNRGVEQQGGDKRPDLKDLRDSGEIEENADTVTALYRDAYYSENPLDNSAELINRKARDGERNARAKMVFVASYMSFEPMAKGDSR